MGHPAWAGEDRGAGGAELRAAGEILRLNQGERFARGGCTLMAVRPRLMGHSTYTSISAKYYRVQVISWVNLYQELFSLRVLANDFDCCFVLLFLEKHT